MINHQEERCEHRYCVQVGHWSVVVEARGESDAVSAARRKLCEELPRLWDVISELDERRFVVHEDR